MVLQSGLCVDSCLNVMVISLSCGVKKHRFMPSQYSLPSEEISPTSRVDSSKKPNNGILVAFVFNVRL